MHDIRDLVVASLTISNDATEQTVYSHTITGNGWTTGTLHRLALGGTVSSKLALPGNLTLKIKLGTVAATVFSEGLNLGIAAAPFTMLFDCLIIPSGPASGTVALQGTFAQNAVDIFTVAGARIATTTGTLDLTQDQTLSVTVQFATADTGNIFVRKLASLLVLTAES